MSGTPCAGADATATGPVPPARPARPARPAHCSARVCSPRRSRDPPMHNRIACSQARSDFFDRQSPQAQARPPDGPPGRAPAQRERAPGDQAAVAVLEAVPPGRESKKPSMSARAARPLHRRALPCSRPARAHPADHGPQTMHGSTLDPARQQQKHPHHHTHHLAYTCGPCRPRKLAEPGRLQLQHAAVAAAAAAAAAASAAASASAAAAWSRQRPTDAAARPHPFTRLPARPHALYTHEGAEIAGDALAVLRLVHEDPPRLRHPSCSAQCKKSLLASLLPRLRHPCFASASKPSNRSNLGAPLQQPNPSFAIELFRLAHIHPPAC